MNQKIKLSRSQRIALDKALWKIESSSNTNNYLYTTRMKWLLLRAFIIYKRRQNLSTAELLKYQQALQQRLQACLELQSEKSIEIPYYLFSFWDEVFNSLNNINKQQTIKTKPVCKKNKSKKLKTKSINIALSNYRKFWVALIKLGLDISNRSSKIIKFKKTLGCISLIPIKIGNEHIKVKGVCIQLLM